MIGQFIQQPAGYKAFVPSSFPPQGLRVDQETFLMDNIATLTLGKLDGLAQLIPDIEFFTYMYAKKEAVLSNNIEGTRATMHDFIRAESGVVENVPEDVVNIVHYNTTLNYGLDRLSEIPLASRLIKEMHKILLPESERSSKDAGNFRRSQNWISGTSPSNADFVPPPPSELSRCLRDLDNFINTDKSYTNLMRVALTHAQFETIHPFLDGNGRIGRLLITLQLCSDEVLTYPILYLSEYLKRHRQVYFDRLAGYRTPAGINRWLQFFLEGVKVVADEAIKVGQALVRLHKTDKEQLVSLGARQAESATKLLNGLYNNPLVSTKDVMKLTGFASRPAAYALINKFVDVGILSRIILKTSRLQYYCHREYLKLFE